MACGIALGIGAPPKAFGSDGIARSRRAMTERTNGSAESPAVAKLTQRPNNSIFFVGVLYEENIIFMQFFLFLSFCL